MGYAEGWNDAEDRYKPEIDRLRGLLREVVTSPHMMPTLALINEIKAALAGTTDQPSPALDPEQLDRANVALACESVRLQEALAFYAERQHIQFTDEGEERMWVTGSDPEAPNWMDAEGVNVMIEDGSVAREALKPFEVNTADNGNETKHGDKDL